MMILDTHAWIWWVADRPRLPHAVQSALRDAPRLGVCAISCWEVAMLAAKGRIKLSLPTGEWVRQALAPREIELLPLSPEVAVLSVELALHGDPADRLIVATAISQDALLVTRDQNIQDFKQVKTLWG